MHCQARWLIKGCFPLLLTLSAAAANTLQTGQSATAAKTATGAVAPFPATTESIARAFQRGQDALAHGQLDEAERSFRQVLSIDPQSGGAYANLGVVYMRRKQWAKALQRLYEAERLMPKVAGIRLNIGLAYYRQNEFLNAIPPFESVVKQQPDAQQPRYLLGLCYFFAERWADAATTLEPLWFAESMHLSYLYVLSNAAHRAGQKDLDERATMQLVKLGDNSPEYHLFIGKYHLNLEQYDLALAEFQKAAEISPKLPFVHFNLGLTYLKKQDYEHARDEFLRDAAIEPDLALNYDELGDVYSRMDQEANAEKSYREAVQHDPKLVNSHLGLAKIYQQRNNFPNALADADAAIKTAPDRTDIHYLRGQILVHMGRKAEGKKELETAVSLDNERRATREKQVEAGTVPSPEVLLDPQ